MPGSSNSLQLTIEVDANGANASVKSINSGFKSMEDAAVRSGTNAAKGLDHVSESMATSVAKGEILVHTFEKLIEWYKEATLDTALYAARTEQLGLALGAMAKSNGLNTEAVRAQAKAVADLGIPYQTAQEAVLKLTGAHLQYTKAVDLANAANNIAHTTGRNLTEVMDALIGAISRNSVDLVENLGLSISFENAYSKASKQLGHDLSDQEKAQIRLNTVLEAAAVYNGTMGASTEGAAGQIINLEVQVKKLEEAFGRQLLPRLAEGVKLLNDFLGWAEKNADVLLKIGDSATTAAIAIAAAQIPSLLEAIAAGITGITAAIEANPIGAFLAGLVVVGKVSYDFWKDQEKISADTQEKIRAEQLKTMIQQGKTLDELHKANFTDEDIKRLLHVEASVQQIKQINEAYNKAYQDRIVQSGKDAEAQKAATEAAKKAATERERIQKDAADTLLKAREALANKEDAYYAAALEYENKLTEARKVGARAIDLQRYAQAYQLNLIGEQRKQLSEYLKAEQENYKARENIWAQEFASRSAFDQQTLDMQIDTAERGLQVEKDQLDQSRELALAQLGTVNAQTVEQKIAVEQRKLAIEVDYLQRSEQLEIEKQQRQAQRDLQILRADVEAGLITEQQYAARADAINEALADRRTEISNSTNTQIQTATMQQASQAADLVLEHTKSVFDSVKQSAGGIFDAMVAKGESALDQLGNYFKTMFLTALKEIMSSQIAALFTKFLTGQSVQARPGMGAGAPMGNSGILGTLQSLFGGGAGSARSTVSATGAMGSLTGGAGVVNLSALGLGPGGTTGFAGPVTGITGANGGGGLLSGGANTSLGGVLTKNSAGLLNLGLMTGGGMLLLGGIGKTGAGGTLSTIAGGGMLGYSVGSQLGGRLGGAVGAEAGIGAGLMMNGIARGGWTGLGESVGGGALAGASIGSIVPGIGTAIGAAIGAGVGLIGGLIGLFRENVVDKAKKHVKSAYGITISDDMAKQIVDISKQNFGSNIDLALSSSQVREMLQLYAMATGQRFGGISMAMQAYTLEQSGGNVVNLPSLLNNQAAASYGGSLPTLSPTATGSNVNVNLQLDGKATTSLLQGQAVNALGSSAGTRAVAQATAAANGNNNGRRQNYVAQASPGLVTS